MTQFTTELCFFESIRQISCCSCGATWELLWVGVALRIDRDSIGYFCPRCVKSSPQETAEKFQNFGHTLLSQTERLRRLVVNSACGNEKELASQAARLRDECRNRGLDLLRNLERARLLQEKSGTLVKELEKVFTESRRLCEESKRLLEVAQRSATPARDLSSLVVLEEVSEEAAILLSMPHWFPKTEQWSVSVEQLIEAERDRVRGHLGGLSEPELRVVVDHRYASFLASSAT